MGERVDCVGGVDEGASVRVCGRGVAVNQADVSANSGVGNACACVMCECMSVFVVVRCFACDGGWLCVVCDVFDTCLWCRPMERRLCLRHARVGT
jgi:hypothetical protein